MKLPTLTALLAAAVLAVGLSTTGFAAPETDNHGNPLAAQPEHHDGPVAEIVHDTEAAYNETSHVGDHGEHGEAGHGGGHDEHEAPPLINPLVWEMIWTIVVFIIFFAVLSIVVWPKILGGLKAREDKQRTDLLGAEKAKADAEKALAEYTEKLAEARKEAQSIVAEARAAAQQAANADKAKIEAEVAAMKASAKADIASAKEQALADIYTQAASLSTMIAGKILQREINEADQQSLVSESVEQFKANASSN